jgi:hypothetical protein
VKGEEKCSVKFRNLLSGVRNSREAIKVVSPPKAIPKS